MGERRIIQGEKYKIKQAIREEIEKNGPVSDERKREIAKQVHKKEKRRVMIGVLAGAIGLAGIGAIGVKTLNQPEESRTNKESTQDIDDKTNEFKEGLKVSSEELDKNNNEKETDEIKKAVDKLENKEDVLNFLKDMYIEEYEKQTGDEKLTTDDISISYNYENYVYVNSETGELITHGEKPAETEQLLKNDGVSYGTKDDVKVYKVRTKSGEVLDCITLGNKDGETIPVKVTIGEQYGKTNDSILVNMGTTIPDGIEYYENIEKDENSRIIAKRKFIKSLEEMNEKEQQNEGSEIGE